MKKKLFLFLCVLTTSCMVCTAEEDDSVIEDLLRSPVFSVGQKEKKDNFKRRMTALSKSMGYLSVWGLSAAAINILLGKATILYGGIKENLIMKNHHAGIESWEKRKGRSYPQELKNNRWWNAAARTSSMYVWFGVDMVLAVTIAYYNWKYHIQGKSYRHFKEVIE